MALYSFPVQDVVFFTIGFLSAVAIFIVAFALDWPAQLRRRSQRRDMRRLAETTATMTRTLADRDRLRADFAVSRQRLEADIQKSRSEAASEVTALHEQLAKKDAALKKLRAQLKDKTAILRPHARGKAQRGGATRSKLRARKSSSRVAAGSKSGAVREARPH